MVGGLSDSIQVEGYRTLNFARPKHTKAKHGSGGITILLNTNVANRIKLTSSPNKDYIWLTLNKNIFNLTQNIHICIAYVPPPDSTYTKRMENNILDLIETDIFKFKKSGEVILMGDFNARVGSLKDYIPNDTDKHLPLDDDYILDTNQPTRNNLDTTHDNRGKHLLEICIGAQLRILNGRKLGDTLGYYTSYQYNGRSTIDYAICSESLLNSIPYFKVHKLEGTLSDHCMISFTLLANRPQNHSTHATLYDMPEPFKWGEGSSEAFQAALNLQSIQTQINDCLTDINNSKTKEDIKLVTQNINAIFNQAARLSLKLKKTKTKTH